VIVLHAQEHESVESILDRHLIDIGTPFLNEEVDYINQIDVIVVFTQEDKCSFTAVVYGVDDLIINIRKFRNFST